MANYVGVCGHSVSKKGVKRCAECAFKARPQAGEVVPAAVPVDSFRVDGNTAEVVKGTNEKVRTLEDLIRVCEIDTKEWEIERWIANKWEVGAKDAQKNVKVTPLFQIKAWLKRKSGSTLTIERLKVELVADIRAEVKRGAPAIVARRFVDSGWLFEFSPFDLHAGKYAWSEECVTNYDADLAADLFDASLDFLLSRALKAADGKLERVLCVFGNDVSHTDNKRGETTAGTRMDVDTRYVRVYRRICAIHRRAVDVLRQVAPVDVKIVPGNHDELTAFHLGEVLAARYAGDKHVSIDNSARLRKYYDFGINLFGFTHGDGERIAELPLLMAREVPDLWSRCSSREWHIGHLHKSEKWEAKARLVQDLHSDKGIRIRRLPSLSAHDFWHTRHGYTDRRAAEGFVFHKSAGFTDHLSFNVDHFSGKALTA